MFNKKFMVFLIVIFILTCNCSSAFLFWDDNYGADEIYVTEVDTGITNTSFELNDGYLEENYMCHVSYSLNNVSSSLIGADIETYLYSGDQVIMSDTLQNNEFSENSNCSIQFIEDDFGYGSHYVSTYFFIDNFTNITHFTIQIVKDEKVVLNVSEPFNMSNYDVENDSTNYEDSSSSSDTLESSTNADSGITYVASENSDIFHYPSCYHAQKIKDKHKITYSSREDAVGSGRTPCAECSP